MRRVIFYKVTSIIMRIVIMFYKVSSIIVRRIIIFYKVISIIMRRVIMFYKVTSIIVRRVIMFYKVISIMREELWFQKLFAQMNLQFIFFLFRFLCSTGKALERIFAF